MSGAAVEEDIDIERLFEGIDESIECDYLDCNLDGTHFLICGVCKVSHETMCNPHTAEAVATQALMPDQRIHFTETCGHGPKFGDCEIRPIG